MLSAEWKVLTEHFDSLCNTLSHNHQLYINKLKDVPLFLKDKGEQLSKMILISSTDSREIKENFLTYLIVKLCYNGSHTTLVRLCDIMDELSDPSGTPTCLQQIRHGMYICLY